MKKFLKDFLKECLEDILKKNTLKEFTNETMEDFLKEFLEICLKKRNVKNGRISEKSAGAFPGEIFDEIHESIMEKNAFNEGRIYEKKHFGRIFQGISRLKCRGKFSNISAGILIFFFFLFSEETAIGT